MCWLWSIILILVYVLVIYCMKKLMVEILHIYPVGQMPLSSDFLLIVLKKANLLLPGFVVCFFFPLPLAIPRETCFQPKEF